MYSVIIVEDDPMVASINRQYVELEPSFSVRSLNPVRMRFPG